MEKIKKENAVQHYFENTVKCDWTWASLTDAERELFENKILPPLRDMIGGTIRQIEDAVRAVYWAYLYGIGYDGPNWRGGWLFREEN